MINLDEAEDAKLLREIKDILNKGNDVLVQRRKCALVVIEQKKKIKYSAELKE